jgi:uroporphyrin-III C-methyltransferase
MMSKSNLEAVLVVGHGSRREEANEDVRDAALNIARRGPISLVTTAFLEIAKPSIGEGFARLVELGARRIIIHPYFLSPGRHTRGDIPVEVKAIARLYPDVTYELTEPLNAHPLVVDASIERIRETSARAVGVQRVGKVYLLGAGPGDPDLLTVRGLRLLRNAEVIVYDNLVDPSLLTHADLRAERIYVGKIGRSIQTPQDQINALLIENALQGKLVVRLKGGDPFLFGRGGEEALALRDAGVEFEVIPGVSSAIAAPAYAGIPLTHRGISKSVTILTGARGGDGKFDDDLLSGSAAETIVILMGLTNLPQIADRLLEAGRTPDTPVAVISWGTYETQKTIVGSLSDIARRVESEHLQAPAVIVVGEVVRLRNKLDWFTHHFAQENFLEVAA